MVAKSNIAVVTEKVQLDGKLVEQLDQLDENTFGQFADDAGEVTDEEAQQDKHDLYITAGDIPKSQRF